MSYTPPSGDNAVLNFGGSYTPPSGDNAVFNFDGVGGSITPTGFVTSAFGTATVARAALTIAPTGLAALGIGTSVVQNKTKYLSQTGSAFGGYGTSTLYNKTKYLLPTGSSFGVYGTPRVSHQHQTLLATGFSGTVLGSPWLTQTLQNITQAGGTMSSYGSATVELQNRTIKPSSFGAAGFGTPTITYRWIGAAGLRAGLFGLQTVSNRTRYLVMSGYSSAAFGAAQVRTNKIAATGLASAAYGTHVVQNFHRRLYPPSITAPNLTPQGVKNKLSFVVPKGLSSFASTFDPFEYDLRLRVMLKANRILPSSIDSMFFSIPDISHPIRTVFPPPVFALPPTQPRVKGLSRLQDSGVQFSEFGYPTAETVDANMLKGKGFTCPVFGQGRLSQRVNYAASLVGNYGAFVVSMQVRSNAITHTGYGTPTYAYADGTDFVCGILPRATPPQGFDAVQFGTTGVTQ